MPVSDYCQRDVRTAAGGSSLADAAARMRDEGVGCLVVLGDDGKPWGVVTDRDLGLRTLRRRLDARTATLEAIVPRDELIVVRESTPVRIAVAMMRKHGIRRLPVLGDDGSLAGLLAWDDLVGLLGQELTGLAAVVRAQGTGAGVPRARAVAELIGEDR